MWAVLHAFAVTLGSTFRARQAKPAVCRNRESPILGEAGPGQLRLKAVLTWATFPGFWLQVGVD
jgi:hypothetical protein